MKGDMAAISSCVPCGQPGQICCALNRCGGGCCSRSGPGDPGLCIAEGQDCSNGAVCVTGACGTCGRSGQRCCESTCTAAGSTCRVVVGQGESCIACGGRGQPCCFDQPDTAPCGSPDLVCLTDVCVER
jgi:hypothetical protein